MGDTYSYEFELTFNSKYNDHVRIYIYTISSPNLGLEIAIPGREREQGRFRGSIEGAGREHGGARESTEGALRGSAEAQQVGA